MNNRGLASFFDFSQIDISKLQEKTIETLYMTGISIIVVAILGLILGLLLFETSGRKGILSRLLYWLVAIFVNIFRSIPFIILIVLLIPFTKIILGSVWCQRLLTSIDYFRSTFLCSHGRNCFS